MELDLDVVAELGLATKKDIDKLVRDMEQRYRENIFAAFSQISDGSGNIKSMRVFDIPDGMQFYPSRYIVWSDAHNPSTGGCFQSTSCWGGIFHGVPSPVTLADYFPPPSGGLGEATTPNIIPYYKEFNKHDSPEFQSPDNVAFQLTNGPPNTNITCILFGWMEEIREGKRFPRPSGRGRVRRRRVTVPPYSGHTEDATLG